MRFFVFLAARGDFSGDASNMIGGIPLGAWSEYPKYAQVWLCFPGASPSHVPKVRTAATRIRLTASSSVRVMW